MSDLLSRFKLKEYQVNPEGGMIYVDRKVQKWLDSFKNGDYNQKSQAEIEIYKRITKSGYEENLDIKPPKIFPAISLILVTYNSEKWLDNLKEMFFILSPWLHEIIIVDNGSEDGSLHGLRQIAYPIKIIENEQSKSFAAAVNQGCRLATGELLLIINPDIYIPKSSLWSLIDFYHQNSDAAAIVPKLMLMNTPGFINGVGNIVPPFRWGYDLGLGHLDVGQFDHVKEVPSACFATVLIPREKWNEVGELDEGYPMYYEDSDWSYRARSAGYKILLNNNSRVFHSYNHQTGKVNISKTKLHNVTFGRLRFTNKNIVSPISYFFIFSYAIFDISYLVFSLIKSKFDIGYAKSIITGWTRFIFHKKFIKKRIVRPHKIINKSGYSLIPRSKNGIPIMKWHNII